MMSFLRNALAKAKKETEETGTTFEDLWEPGDSVEPTDSIYTDETEDPDEEYAEVHGVGDIDVAGKVPGVFKKGGLAGDIFATIQDLKDAQASLAEIGDSLDNVGKASACSKCGGKISASQRNQYRRMMAQRGWTPDSHRGFWSKISSGIEKDGPGGHRACVGRMEGKVDDPHSFCAWAEAESTGQWPSEHKRLDGAMRKVRKASAEVSRRATELRKATQRRK
jgi:uncharacterized membrane protein